MAEGDSKNLDERNVKFVTDDSESLSRLRIDNFNLRLLCHKYEEVFNKGQVRNMGLRMYEAEQNIENLRHQLSNASEVISSLKHENDGLKKDNEEWSEKLESSEIEWRKKYDLLFFEFQELKSSQRRVENRCETVECDASRLENVKNAEIATLLQKLTSSESQVAVLEAELAELHSKMNVSNLHDDRENSSLLLNFSALLDPLPSPIKNNNLSLQRRYAAAQEMLKSLKSNCDSLSSELTTCKQELSLFESKLRLILEKYEEEKAAHLKDLEQRDELERNLHDRIANLVSECHLSAERNDELAVKVRQLKESEVRLKETHSIEVKKLNRLLVDRERALLELYTPDTQTETNAPHIEDTEPTGEVTQYHHEPDSSIFNSTVDASVAGAFRKEGNTQLEAISVEMNKLQHEVALLRSKLVSQVKANTRLKAAFNALSESNPPPPKVAGIQEALDAWSLDAATELLAAINVNADDIHQPPASSHKVTGNASANMDTLLNLVIRFVEVLSKTKSVEVAVESTSIFSDWCDLVYRWFEIFIDTLQGRRGSADLTEVGSRLSALELQFNEEFALTATVTQHPITLSRQNAGLQVSDITEPPSVSLYENGDNVSSRCEQLTSTIDKLKADLSLNVRELTDKEIAVADLESKVQDLEAKLTETFSIARTKESKVEELEVEVANMESKARDLERQLNKALSDTQAKGFKIEMLEAELPQMETKLQELEAELGEATSKARAKEKKVEELEAEVNESKTRLQRTDAQLAEALLAVRVKDAKVEEMEAVIKDKESTLASLKEQLAETETMLAQKKARVVELKVAANELRAIYDDLDNQLNKATKDMEDWKTKSERLEDLLTESIERETGFSQQLRQAFDEVNNLNRQKSALETQLKEKLEEHNAKMQSTHIKYESLLEVAKSRYTEMAEQCERLQTERDNLCEDLQMSKEEKLMLQTDLTMARMVSADAQINLGAYLEDGPTGDKEDLEAIRQKARKYPELKSLAFTLKDKVDRSAGLIHDFTKENTRLKMIVSDHEKRVKELANELERLREQILVKNEVIRKLESLVRLSATDPPISTLSEKLDEISPTENARGANFRSSNLFNTDVTMDLADVGILNSHLLPEHLNGVNSLMADIGATVREISGCLDPMTAEGGEQQHSDISASLATQISSLSTDTPSSLNVSVGDLLPSHPARNLNVNSFLPNRLNHLVHKLSTFWSAMTLELQTLIITVQSTAVNTGDCGRGDYSRARKLVRRSVEALGNLNSRYPTCRSFTHILASLNEALELLCRQNPSSTSSSLTSLRPSLSSSRGQEEETGGIALPPPAGTTSSCSCSCRHRCSRLAASVQELTTMLNTTANALTRGRTVAFSRGNVEKVQAENYYASPQDSLSN
nr:hypothetical protein HmN_000258700 [Hymenolepis microstoma]